MKLFGSRNPYVLSRSLLVQLVQSKKGLSRGSPLPGVAASLLLGTGRSEVRPIQEVASLGGNDNIYFLGPHLSPLPDTVPAAPS